MRLYGHKCVVMASAEMLHMSLIHICQTEMQKIISMQTSPDKLLRNSVS